MQSNGPRPAHCVATLRAFLSASTSQRRFLERVSVLSGNVSACCFSLRTAATKLAEFCVNGRAASRTQLGSRPSPGVAFQTQQKERSAPFVGGEGLPGRALRKPPPPPLPIFLCTRQFRELLSRFNAAGGASSRPSGGASCSSSACAPANAQSPRLCCAFAVGRGAPPATSPAGPFFERAEEPRL